MSAENLIPIQQLCSTYQVEMSFFNGIIELDMIEFVSIEQTYYLHQDKINDLEKIIRLHQELYINLEGIDTVFHLLKKIDRLQAELMAIKTRLGLYEN